MKRLLLLLLFPTASMALPSAPCLPGAANPINWECSSAGCAMIWLCPNTSTYFELWGHTDELATAANQIWAYITQNLLGSLISFNAVVSQIPVTSDDYSDLTPLLSDLVAKYPAH
jgi:hypothetical protein